MFTIEEAARLLPQLTQWLTELREERNLILASEVEIDALELVTEKKKGSESSPALDRKVGEYTRRVDRFYSLIDKIQGTGCVLKDLETGLVDFYSLQNNRVVFLCWKLGEPAISSWHEIGGGYASRQGL